MPTDVTSLVAPERNRYFYGLMMDAEGFERDQDYFNRKRLLINRFVSGIGVVCGLDLAFDASKSTLTLSPGIAIDAAGREIVVLDKTPVDITQLTDAKGKPTGPVPAGSTILISLIYAEQCVDQVPVLVPDCDHPDGCAPSTIKEGFRVTVSVASGVTVPVKQCVFGSMPAVGAALQAAIAQRVAARFGPARTDVGITLGQLSLPGGPLDGVSLRQVVYNNQLLYELIACLALQVSQSTALTYVSGDNQTAASGATLPIPLVVALVDSGGNPVTTGAAPTFTVTSGGGSVGPVTNPSPGNYETNWTLGSSGAQVVTAQSAQSSLTVTLHAAIKP